MRIRINLPTEDATRLRERIIKDAETVEADQTGQNGWEAVMLIDPSKYHVFNELLTKECKGKGRIETVTFAATATVPAEK